MSEGNKAIFQQIIDAINAQDVAAIGRLFGPNFVDHDPAPGQGEGPQGLADMMQMFFSGFPDLKVTVNRMISEGDLVGGAMTIEGTQTGAFMGIPASGKKVSFTEMHMVRIVNGKAVEHWGVVDSMTLMQQLGVMPTE